MCDNFEENLINKILLEAKFSFQSFGLVQTFRSSDSFVKNSTNRLRFIIQFVSNIPCDIYVNDITIRKVHNGYDNMYKNKKLKEGLFCSSVPGTDVTFLGQMDGFGIFESK